jgi:surfactin family lipopeptide synthetase A
MEIVQPAGAAGPLSDAKRKLLEAILKGHGPTMRSKGDSIACREPSASVPLSLAQEEIWYRVFDAPGTPPFYNESITIYREGPLDVRAVEWAFMEIVRRHEAWRTTFDMVNGTPRQIVHPPPQSFPIARYDLSTFPTLGKEDEALRLATEQAREPFNLKTGPLVRVRLIDTDEKHHRVYVTMHQIIVDGISVFRVLPAELSALCEAFSRGKPASLAKPRVQYGDFACWQETFLNHDVLEQQLAYWRKQLSGKLPAYHWPNDANLHALHSHRGAIIPGAWSKECADELRGLCQEESVTLFTALLAGFVFLCYYSTGNDDIVVGTLAPAGRERQEVQGLLGYFLNPVALRFRILKDMTFRDLLHQVREVVSGAVANDDVPFHRVVERISGSRLPAHNPFFDAVISLAPGLPQLPPGWTQTFMDVESGGSTWNFYLEFNERTDGLIFRMQYNPDRFDRGTICRITEDLKLSLMAACAEPQKGLSELRLK